MAGYTSVIEAIIAKFKTLNLSYQLLKDKNEELADLIESDRYSYLSEDYMVYQQEKWLWEFFFPRDKFPGVAPENVYEPVATKTKTPPAQAKPSAQPRAATHNRHRSPLRQRNNQDRPRDVSRRQRANFSKGRPSATTMEPHPEMPQFPHPDRAPQIRVFLALQDGLPRYSVVLHKTITELEKVFYGSGNRQHARDVALRFGDVMIQLDKSGFKVDGELVNVAYVEPCHQKDDEDPEVLVACERAHAFLASWNSYMAHVPPANQKSLTSYLKDYQKTTKLSLRSEEEARDFVKLTAEAIPAAKVMIELAKEFAPSFPHISFSKISSFIVESYTWDLETSMFWAHGD